MTDSLCENCGHDQAEHVSLDHRAPTFCRVEGCACNFYVPPIEECLEEAAT